MKAYFKQLCVEWNVCRIVRIAGGLPIMLTGIIRHDWPTGLFGAAFIAAGLFSTQCCATGSCGISNNSPSHKQQAVEFEEVK